MATACQAARLPHAKRLRQRHTPVYELHLPPEEHVAVCRAVG